LIGEVKRSPEATINQQMQLALDKVAFLPFGKLIDEWRWRVFDGEVKPENYNAAWWQLREQYQGVGAPVARTEEDFDPGAKYHVPANTSYTRYFLSYILQFQFHRALCEAAGNKGPLYECSVYGNTEAGKRFREMLALGQSQPWQDTLEKLTGTRQMGRIGDPRLLRAVAGVAQRTESRPDLRLVNAHETPPLLVMRRSCRRARFFCRSC
jgi:peptidyl-dipeptidase A